jgi:hypothetical protein
MVLKGDQPSEKGSEPAQTVNQAKANANPRQFVASGDYRTGLSLDFIHF